MKNIHYILKTISFALAILPILGNAMEPTLQSSKKSTPELLRHKPIKKSLFRKEKKGKRKIVVPSFAMTPFPTDTTIKNISDPVDDTQKFSPSRLIHANDNTTTSDEENFFWLEKEKEDDSAIDEETEMAVKYYTDAWIGDSVVINGLKWANNNAYIDKNNITTAIKEMTDALNKLLSKNKIGLKLHNDKTENRVLGLGEAQNNIEQTKCITDHLEILQKNEQRIEAARYIIKNKFVQLDEPNLRAFHDACKNQEDEFIQCLGNNFALVLHNLKRLEAMRSRTHKKSLSPNKIGYQQLNIKPVSIFEKAMEKIEVEKKESDEAIKISE